MDVMILIVIAVLLSSMAGVTVSYSVIQLFKNLQAVWSRIGILESRLRALEGQPIAPAVAPSPPLPWNITNDLPGQRWRGPKHG